MTLVDKLAPVAGIELMVAEAIDGITTYIALKHGAKETNPFLITVGLSNHPLVLMLIKLGIGFGLGTAFLLPGQNVAFGVYGTLVAASATAYVGIRAAIELFKQKIL